MQLVARRDGSEKCSASRAPSQSNTVGVKIESTKPACLLATRDNMVAKLEAKSIRIGYSNLSKQIDSTKITDIREFW